MHLIRPDQGSIVTPIFRAIAGKHSYQMVGLDERWHILWVK